VSNELIDRQGRFVFLGGQTWFRSVGDPRAGVPLVVLHGGPGFPSFYLENLVDLARPDRAVIFYDQISCGRSTGTSEPKDWNFQTFIDQFAALLDHLELNQVDVLGHSWGGFLLLELALRRPELVRRMVLASTSPSAQMFIDTAEVSLETMPASDVEVVRSSNASGDYDSADYKRVESEFLRLFCNGMDELPELAKESNRQFNVSIYQYLWGPSEFRCTGTLGDWDVSERLTEITHPVLITSGAKDEAGPAIQRFMLDNLPNARWECFENSAHYSHWTDHDDFVNVVDAFLT
jgi:proline-specific peptidase